MVNAKPTDTTHQPKKLNDLVRPYLRRWYYFLLSTLVTLALGYLLIKMTPPVYKAITTVLIKDAKNMSPASGDFGILQSLGGIGGMGTSSIENEMEIFRSKTIVEDVLKNQPFQIRLLAEGPLKNTELYGRTAPYIIRVVNEKPYDEVLKEPVYISSKGNQISISCEQWPKTFVGHTGQIIALPFANIIVENNKNYRADKDTKNQPVRFVYSTFEDLVNDYQEALMVDLQDKDGTVISLSVNFENREKAKDFLNSLVRQYNIYAISDKNIENKKTKDFIDDRIALISKELGEVETEKQNFKAQNNIVDLPTEAKINLTQREETRSRMVELETQKQINDLLQGALNGKTVTDVLPLNIGLDNASTASLIGSYNALVLRRNKLLENATPANPEVKDLEKQIRVLKASLNESLQKNAYNIELAKQKAQAQFSFNSTNIERIPQQERLFRNIERQQQIKENLYLLLLQKREEAAISMEITSEKARVVDKAYTQKKPVAPKKLIIMSAALLAGLLIPFGIIYLREVTNTKLVNRKDIAAHSQIPIIGEIPRLKGGSDIIIQPNDISPVAESFRILMTNLKYLLPSKPYGKKILVTSSVKGEGKTFISVNLSLVLAAGGNKVLVIGSDIRNPQLQRYRPEMKGRDGLTEFLHGSTDDVDSIIHPSGFHSNCDFIFSGKIPPNPADLLQNGRYAELLKRVEDRYHFIILDTAPLMLVTDSFLISALADATVYVVRSEYSDYDFIEFANNAVESEKIRNVSFALNDIAKQNFGYGNTYGYGYHAADETFLTRLRNRFRR